MKINVFLPCRKGSERVPKKNIKPFGTFENGLIDIKLQQLLRTENISKIYLSTNDEEILEFADKFNNNKIILHKRDEVLSSSQTSTDDLILHASNLIKDEHILWTHVTSPFLNEEVYNRIIEKYISSLKDGFDSLMTTNLIHAFLWNKKGSLNYDRKIEKWPRTQTIEPIHEVNSGVFLAHSNIYKENKDRIGQKPFLYTLDKIEGFDIDWEDDFKIAEALLKSKVTKV